MTDNRYFAIGGSLVFLALLLIACLTQAFDNQQAKTVLSLGILVSFTAGLTGTVRWVKYGAKMSFKKDEQ